MHQAGGRDILKTVLTMPILRTVSMSTGKIVNEIKTARQRSKHCKEYSASWPAAEC